MSNAREILQRTGLVYWQNKTFDEMTDVECEQCLLYIEEVTRKYYIREAV